MQYGTAGLAINAMFFKNSYFTRGAMEPRKKRFCQERSGTHLTSFSIFRQMCGEIECLELVQKGFFGNNLFEQQIEIPEYVFCVTSRSAFCDLLSDQTPS